MTNACQMALCVIVIFSILLLGIKIYQRIDPGKRSFLNRYVYLGEVLLLGAIVLIGALLFLSFLGLYRPPFLIAATLLNVLWLFDPAVRFDLKTYIFRPVRWDIGTVLFLGMISFFIFRNCYFLSDVDSLSTYLYTQQLWVAHGSSLTGNPSDSFITFLPQFDYILDSIGLSLWSHETLYPALINLFWRIIVLLLLFGYTKYRLKGSFIALAAVLLTLFNEHFFYSGVDRSVLINGALLALLFAAVYNFWEARRLGSLDRFILACIFLSQLPANKYQMMYVTFFLFVVGVLIQKDKKLLLKGLLGDQFKIICLVLAAGILSLWFIKDFLMTGDPLYPRFSGQWHLAGWTLQKQVMFMKVFGGISLPIFLKYMSFLFIWPGIKAAKLVLLLIYVFPMSLLFLPDKSWDKDKDQIKEVGYWLGTSMLILLGICLVCHQDSRFYRFPLAVFSFAAVYGWYFLLIKLGRLPSRLAAAMLLIFAAANSANEGYYIPLYQGGIERYPSYKENIEVLKGRLHSQQAVIQRYPEIEQELQLAQNEPEKFDHAAWDMIDSRPSIPLFWLPQRPVLDLWCSNLIHWDSYGDPQKIVQDLHDRQIDWVLVMTESGGRKFMPVEEYAETLTAQMRFPSKRFYAYSGIPELDEMGSK